MRATYTPHIPPRAILYQRSEYTLGLFALGWNLLGLWLLLQSGTSARLRNAVYRTLKRPLPAPETPPLFRAVALYFIAYALLLALWNLPTGLTGWALEQHFGFSRQNAGGFLSDRLLQTLFSLVVIPVVWAGYRLYARSPRHWWKWLWAALVPLLFVQYVLQPVVIAPAFNRFTPLASGPLRDKILALASKAGITGGRVYVTDTSRRTSHVNAYVTGLGPTTRIVLNDTAIQTLPEDELLAMMGHEMGHYVEGHIWIQLLSGSVGAGAFLWLAAWLLPRLEHRYQARWRLHSLLDLAALPLVMLVLSAFLLAQSPLANAESRYLEHRADAFGLRVTGLNDAMARLFVRFAERDYSDPNPPALIHLWFGSHPTLSERIAFVRSFHANAPQ